MKPPDVEPMALTVPQTAQALGVSPSTVFRMLADGELPCVHIKGIRRVLRADLERWLHHLRRQERLASLRRNEGMDV